MEEFIANTEIVFRVVLLMAYRNFPEGSDTDSRSTLPSENGDPATALKAPVVAFTVNADTPAELAM